MIYLLIISRIMTQYMYTNRVKQTNNAGTNCHRFPLVCHLDVSRQCVLTSKFIPIYLLIFLSVGVSSYGTLSKGVFWYSFLLVCYPLIFLYVGLLSFHIFSGWCTTFFDSPFYMSVCYLFIFLPDRWFLKFKNKINWEYNLQVIKKCDSFLLWELKKNAQFATVYFITLTDSFSWIVFGSWF